MRGDLAWQVKYLYDGGCPMCTSMKNLLQRQDNGRGKILFIDISDEAYSPSQNMVSKRPSERANEAARAVVRGARMCMHACMRAQAGPLQACMHAACTHAARMGFGKVMGRACCSRTAPTCPHSLTHPSIRSLVVWPRSH